MSSKFRDKYLTIPEINFKNHWAVGIEYSIVGSRGDKYTVVFTDKGFSCECIGMAVHGKCKHTKEISNKWVST